MFLVLSMIFIIILCILIVASILLQEDKSHGGIGFIGGTSQSIFGVSSGSVLAKITSILFTIFIIFLVIISIVISQKTADFEVKKEAIKEVELSNYIDKRIDFINKDLSADIKK